MTESIKDRVKELEKTNRLLAENIVDVIFVLDAKTLTYEYVTSSIYKISGFTSEELLNASIIDRLPPESLKMATELLKKGIEEYERGAHLTKAIEIELFHKNGSTYWVEMKAKLLTR